jgi:hypothetical protein
MSFMPARHCDCRADVAHTRFHALARGAVRAASGNRPSVRVMAGPPSARGFDAIVRQRRPCSCRATVAAVAATGFHLIPLPLGGEEHLLDTALDELESVGVGETAFLPEYLAWTPEGSGRAFARLIAYAQDHDINIVTTLNLGGELVEDLPGHDPTERYNALVIFTRHGAVHVPQAKVTTQSFEMDKTLDGPGISVSPYDRLNAVQLDVDEELVVARFFICSDLAVLEQLAPSDLECDLMIVLGNFAFGAERAASRVIGRALAAHVAGTAIHVNAFHQPRDGRPALANRVEEVLDATRGGVVKRKWPSTRAMRGAFYVYDDADARDFASMCLLPKRRGRIAVPRSRWHAPASPGVYPVTVVL